MYIPKPIDTSEVVLSQDMLDLTELIAENTHDVWAAGSIREGRTLGDCRDDMKKTTPLLVPYEQLEDSEKNYDRNTSIEVIKVILKLGYRITKD